MDQKTFELKKYDYEVDDLTAYYLSKSQKGDIFIGTYKTLYKITSSNLPPIKVFSFPQDMEKFGNGIFEDENNNLWIGTRHDGILKIDGSGNLMHHYKIGHEVNNIWTDENKTIWAMTYGGLYRKQIKEMEFSRIHKYEELEEEDKKIRALDNFFGAKGLSYAYRDRKNQFWMMHDIHYASVYQKKQKRLVDLTSLADFSYVTCVYSSHDEISWIGTPHGLFKVNIEPKPIKNILNLPTETRSIRGLVEDENGLIYIGTYGDFYVWDPISGILDNVKIKKVIWDNGTATEYKDSDSSPSFTEYGMLYDDYGLWIADEGNGLLHYDLSSQTLQVHKTHPGEIIHGITLMEDEEGLLWMGANLNLYTFNKEALTMAPFEKREHDFANFVKVLYKDNNGFIWIGSIHGLFRMEKKTNTVISFGRGKDGFKLKNPSVLALHNNPKDILWIGTQGGGLNRMNTNTGEIISFTQESHGLTNNTICSILEDDDGYLWLGSNNGLMRFDPSTYQVKTYSEKDGLTHPEFNHSAALKAKDGTLYFEGIQGLNSFKPQDLLTQDIESKIILTKLQKYDGKKKKFSEMNGYSLQKEFIDLDYRDRSLVLEVALADYRSPKENQFAYRLYELDTTWHYMGNNRQIILNELPAGRFTLQVKARNNNGDWSKKQLHIPLRMTLAFYKNPIFIISCIVAVLLILFSLFQWRTKKLRQQQVSLEKMVKERTYEINEQKTKIEKQSQELKELDVVKSRFFTNISHELRTPLTLISGPLNRWAKKYGSNFPERKELEVMQRNTKNLLFLVEEILDLSKLEINKLELNEHTVHFHSFVKRIVSAFESHAQSRSITFLLQYEIDQDSYLLLDSSKIEKILNNLLSNAFKFTPEGGEIQVTVKKTHDKIWVSVRDNGRGIHPDDLPYIFDRFYQSKQVDTRAEGGTGIGLALSNALAKLMQADLIVNSTYGKGSLFTLKLQINQAPHPEIIKSKPKEEEEEEEEEGFDITTTDSLKISEDMETCDKNEILVVEDHPDMRDFIKSILSPFYMVNIAENGKQALKILSKNPKRPDLILSDVMMPDMDGIELLKKIRGDKRWRDLPVTLLTARASQEDKLQALITGVDDYITKPFDPEELLTRIQCLLSNYRLRQQWQKEKDAQPKLDVTYDDTHISWDTGWLKKVEIIVKREIANKQFKVSDLAYEMAVSQSQLLRKTKDITGLTPEQFIREVKLQKARNLLENRVFPTVSEVAYAIGFDTPEYFSKRYNQRFGKRPTTYLSKSII